MKSTVIGLDIGGTKIYAARFDRDSKILSETKIATEAHQGRDTVLKNLIQAIESVRDESVKAIGVSWAGFVQSERGVISKAPNIDGFEDFALADFLSEKFSLPVKIENDARLFALAEQHLHPTRPKVFLGIILGTGVGSGIILDGKIFQGNDGYAGEIGHMFLGTENQEVESLFAGPGLSKFFQEKIQQSDMREIEDHVEEDRVKFEELLQEHFEAMAQWFYNLSLILNPEVIVLGGGVGKHFWSYFRDTLETKTNTLFEENGYPLRIQLEISQIKNAGAVGAGMLARDFFE